MVYNVKTTTTTLACSWLVDVGRLDALGVERDWMEAEV